MNVPEIKKALEVLSGFPGVFFVGGGLRDLLTGRFSHDMDLVVEGAEKAALAVAKSVDGTLVRWGDKDRGVCFRFVFPRKSTMAAEGRTGGNTSRQAWLDITELEGDIVEDLGRRDFTVNALAVPLEEILPVLARNKPARDCVEEMVIDPFGGLADLKRGILREVSGSIFLDDPLRLWRVWRFSAQLGFLPAENLKQLVSKNAHLCRKVAGERTRAEIFCLLAQPDAGTWLLEAGKYGLVENQFPQMIPMIDCIQGGYHHQDVWGHSFQVVLELDNLIERVNDFFPDDDALFGDWLSRGNNLPVLKLAALLHDIGKPLVREIDDKNRVRFFDHERAGLGLTKEIADELKLSARDKALLLFLVKRHFQIQDIVERSSSKTQEKFWREHGEDTAGLFLLGCADLLSKKGERLSEGRVKEVLSVRAPAFLKKWRERVSPRFEEPSLLDGWDIMARFGLPASELVGYLKDSVREAQLDGKISTRREAFDLAKKLLYDKLGSGADSNFLQ